MLNMDLELYIDTYDNERTAGAGIMSLLWVKIQR